MTGGAGQSRYLRTTLENFGTNHRKFRQFTENFASRPSSGGAGSAGWCTCRYIARARLTGHGWRGRAGMWRARYRSLHVGLLCRALSFAEHSPLQSTLLCCVCFFAEHSPLQSTLLCRFFAEHTLALLCRALSFAEHSPLQSTLLCRARSFLQSTLLFAEHAPFCRARFFAEHSPLQSALLCRALSFAEHASLQSTLVCRALSFAGMETSQLWSCV